MFNKKFIIKKLHEVVIWKNCVYDRVYDFNLHFLPNIVDSFAHQAWNKILQSDYGASIEQVKCISRNETH